VNPTPPLGPVTIGSHPDGDGTHIDVRLVVAPATGRFTLVDAADRPQAGDLIDHGTVIGHVLHAGAHQPVRSFCTGVLVQVTAQADDQVRAGEPLAWLRPVGR
jgi:biotin carboxyl carrier protein